MSERTSWVAIYQPSNIQRAIFAEIHRPLVWNPVHQQVRAVFLHGRRESQGPFMERVYNAEGGPGVQAMLLGWSMALTVIASAVWPDLRAGLMDAALSRPWLTIGVFAVWLIGLNMNTTPMSLHVEKRRKPETYYPPKEYKDALTETELQRLRTVGPLGGDA